MKTATKQQTAVLRSIAEFIGRNGYPPTLREIGHMMGISSLRGVTVHLDPLETKGYLHRGNGARALCITEAGHTLLADTPREEVPMSVYEEIQTERARQDAKWGEQNHPLILPLADTTKGENCTFHLCFTADIARRMCEARFKEKTCSWADIMLEEFAEALEVGCDPVACRAELIQTAAVFVAWIECIDRKEGVK